MYKQVVDGVKVWVEDEDGEPYVMYPECVGCPHYFDEDPCEDCGMEEA